MRGRAIAGRMLMPAVNPGRDPKVFEQRLKARETPGDFREVRPSEEGVA